MKFNIKNLLNKKSIKKLEKATMVGVASLALIIPLGMGSSSNIHADGLTGPVSPKSRTWAYDILVNPSDDMATRADELQDIWEHPFLKHTHAAKEVFEDSICWDGDAYDAYAHHFKQLYSPYLYSAMPKKITSNEAVHYKRDEYLLHKGQEQLGLLGHHKRARRIRRVHYAKRRARKPRKRKSVKRRNHKSNRNKLTRLNKRNRKRSNKHIIRKHRAKVQKNHKRKPRKRITYWFK